MGHFSKDIYDKKREYAFRVSLNSLRMLATKLVLLKKENKDVLVLLENIVNDLGDLYGKYFGVFNENGMFDNWESLIDLDEKKSEKKEKDIERIKNDIETVMVELEPLVRFSHMRHNLHSNEDVDLFDEEMWEEVRRLNNKYHFVDEAPPKIKDIEMIPTMEDPEDFLVEYFGLDESEWLDEDGNWLDDDKKDEIYSLIKEEVRSVCDDFSEKTRAWFKKLNSTWGTDFPD